MRSIVDVSVDVLLEEEVLLGLWDVGGRAPLLIRAYLFLLVHQRSSCSLTGASFDVDTGRGDCSRGARGD